MEEYNTDDLIVPILAEQGRLRGADVEPKCPIRVVIGDHDVRLWVGPRDWQWDRKTGRLIGAGTSMCSSSPPESAMT